MCPAQARPVTERGLALIPRLSEGSIYGTALFPRCQFQARARRFAPFSPSCPIRCLTLPGLSINQLEPLSARRWFKAGGGLRAQFGAWSRPHLFCRLPAVRERGQNHPGS